MCPFTCTWQYHDSAMSADYRAGAERVETKRSLVPGDGFWFIRGPIWYGHVPLCWVMLGHVALCSAILVELLHSDVFLHVLILAQEISPGEENKCQGKGMRGGSIRTVANRIAVICHVFFTWPLLFRTRPTDLLSLFNMFCPWPANLLLVAFVCAPGQRTCCGLPQLLHLAMSQLPGARPHAPTAPTATFQVPGFKNPGPSLMVGGSGRALELQLRCWSHPRPRRHWLAPWGMSEEREAREEGEERALFHLSPLSPHSGTGRLQAQHWQGQQLCSFAASCKPNSPSSIFSLAAFRMASASFSPRARIKACARFTR